MVSHRMSVSLNNTKRIPEQYKRIPNQRKRIPKQHKTYP